MTAPAPDRHDKLHHEAALAGSGLPPLLLEADHLINTVTAGLHGRRRAGMGETFWQYRPYVAGDVSTQIDWRQSARSSNRLYIRQREWEIAATAWLWRDPGHSLDYASSADLPTKRYRAEVLATALTGMLARAGERVGYAGLHRQPFLGRKAAELFAAELMTHGVHEDRLPPVIAAEGHKRCVLFSDFFLAPDDLEPRLKAIAAAKTTGCLVQIVDPAEEDYPFQGRTEFLSPGGTDAPLLFGDAGAVAREYARLFRAHHDWLADVCRHYGWSLLLHRTDHRPEAALIALYRALSPEAPV